jgi:hypothetical protein
MGAACSQHWWDEKLLLTKSELETARDPELEGNIKIGLNEMDHNYADWIALARIGTGGGSCEHICEL